MKTLLTALAILTLTGCATLDRIRELIPERPDRPAPEQPAPEEPKPPADSRFPPPGVSQDQNFLWKPDAHVGGRGVAVLLPARERGHVDRIEVVQGGQVIQSIGRHRTNEPWINGARPHFYTGRPASAYTGPLIIRGLRSDGGRPEWSVADPSRRTSAR